MAWILGTLQDAPSAHSFSKSTKSSSLSSHDLLGLFSLAFAISSLTHPIFSPLIAPSSSSVLCKVPKTWEAQFTLCAPSLPPQNPSLPPLLPSLPKITHRAVACWGYGDRQMGVRGNGGWDGRKGGRLCSVYWLFLLIRVYTTLGKLSGKWSNPPFWHPLLSLIFVLKHICSSEHDMAILPGTAINNFSLLNLVWCDSLSAMSLSLWAITPLSFSVLPNWKLRAAVFKSRPQPHSSNQSLFCSLSV